MTQNAEIRLYIVRTLSVIVHSVGPWLPFQVTMTSLAAKLLDQE